MTTTTSAPAVAAIPAAEHATGFVAVAVRFPADPGRIADDLDALREIIPSELHELVLDAVNQPAVEDLDI